MILRALSVAFGVGRGSALTIRSDELTGDVGERRSDLKVSLVKGDAAANVTLGGNAEPTTTSEQERAKREIKFPSLTAVEFSHHDSRWLFLVNSANSPASFTVAGWPADSPAVNAFAGTPIALKNSDPLRMELPAYGVSAIRFGKSER